MLTLASSKRQDRGLNVKLSETFDIRWLSVFEIISDLSYPSLRISICVKSWWYALKNSKRNQRHHLLQWTLYSRTLRPREKKQFLKVLWLVTISWIFTLYQGLWIHYFSSSLKIFFALQGSNKWMDPVSDKFIPF